MKQILVLLALSAMLVCSCSSDDDNDSSKNSIVGEWGLNNAYYMFSSDGTGLYDSGGDVWGSFVYNTEGGSVYIRITYVNSKYQNIWHDELSGRL